VTSKPLSEDKNATVEEAIPNIKFASPYTYIDRFILEENAGNTAIIYSLYHLLKLFLRNLVSEDLCSI